MNPSQSSRILSHLESHRGEWVPMPELARIGSGSPDGFCMVHSRISDLRKSGEIIGHKNEWVGKEVHSFYRLEIPLSFTGTRKFDVSITAINP